MKAILLSEAEAWLEANCENKYTRIAILGIIQSMPTVDYQETLNEPERAGLYGKYTVRKSSDGQLVAGCFVLRPDKDPVAATALRAYAAATDNTELAADIINWVGAEPNESLSWAELLKMDGRPVYVVFKPDNSGYKLQFWTLVSVDEWDDVYLANKYSVGHSSSGLYLQHLSSYLD